MTGWQAVVVAPGNIRSRFYIAFGTDDNGLPFRYCDASPGIEYPRSSDIDTFTEFMIQTQTDGVAAVIFIRKPFTLADGTIFETVIGLCQRICQPAGSLSQSLLYHHFQTKGTSFTHFYLFLPISGSAEKGNAILIFQYVTHLLIISLYRELPASQTGIIASKRVLIGIHGAYVFGNWYPKIRGHREGSG